MDPQALLNQRLERLQANEKTFSDKLRERRDFVQGQENTASPIFARLLEGGNGEARVASTDVINPLRDFTTENTRSIQAGEADLERAGDRTDNVLNMLMQLSENQANRGLQERKLALEEASMGAVYNPETGRYEINQSALSEEAIKGETDLRKEFTSQVKESGFNDVKAAYEKVKNTSGTPAGDLSLVFAYMKMLDPGSAVREGEYANAENTAGVPEQIRNQYNKLIRGEKLSDRQRANFKSEAGTIYNSYIDRHNSLVDSYSTLASEYGVSPDRVTRVAPKAEKVKVTTASASGGIDSLAPEQSIGDKVLNFLFGGYGKTFGNSPFGIGQSGQMQSGGYVIEQVE